MLHSQCFAFIQKSGKKSQTRWGCSHDPMKAPTVDAINIFIQKTSLKKVYFSGLRQKSSYPLARCKLKNTLRLYKNGIFKWIFNISTCINRILSINSHPEISTCYDVMLKRESPSKSPWKGGWFRVNLPNLVVNAESPMDMS